MIAYCVHDEKSQDDIIVIPDRACAVRVNTERLKGFISPDPVFAQWSGDTCVEVSPDKFGTVVATRDDGGDVCVMKPELWAQTMERYLGAIKPGQK